MFQLPSADLTQMLGQIARLKDLLDLEQPGFSDRVIAKQQAADERFRTKGYAVWPDVSRHPYATGLVAYRHLLAGTVSIEDPALHARLLPIAEDAFALDAFKIDWQDHAKLLAARLRSERECLKTLFELRTCLHLRNLGHNVEYLAVKNAGLTGPDLAVRGDNEIDFECVLADQDGGRSVPVRTSMQVGVQLLQAMERLGVHRLVFISTDGKFAPADTHPLISAIKPELAEDPPRELILMDGKYRATIVGGGSSQEPLPTSEALRLVRSLHQAPVRWGIVNPPSKRLIVPGRLVRGVSIRSTRADDAIKHLAETAFAKAGQYTTDRPVVVVAGFGMPLTEQQARAQLLGLALQRCLGSSLERRMSVSGVSPNTQRRPPVDTSKAATEGYCGFSGAA